MQKTRNEVKQTERAQLLEVFVAVKGTGGFNIVEVSGSSRKTYGPGSTFGVVTNATTDEPQVEFQRGDFIETATKFTVPSDGLYHVVMDTEVGIIAIIPVKYWGLIGAATPNGWSGDSKMESTGFDLNTMTFRATDVAMTIGDFKFRYSGGWKVEIDPTFDLGGGDMGIKVNTNFGGAVGALVPGGDNMPNTVSGYYTATMTWTAGSGFTATMLKTGDLPLKDWSNIELGLIGNGLVVGGVQHDWNSGVYLNKPAANGSKYTYSWPGVEVTTAGSFKIREGDNWDNASFGFPQVVMAGDGAADFETNGDGNFVPKVDGAMYNISFEIDAATDTNTFTVTKI
ncbi:MAG: hypothetical protein IPJ40_00325 [Saprospirales bacterium]|nr:hypothetical protein [Saprospirales bacterium]